MSDDPNTLADLAAAHRRIRDLESENADLKRRLRRMQVRQPEPMSRRGEGVMSPQVDDARLLGPWSDKDRAELRRVLLAERGQLRGELREVEPESWRATAITHRLREIARLLEGMGGE